MNTMKWIVVVMVGWGVNMAVVAHGCDLKEQLGFCDDFKIECLKYNEEVKLLSEEYKKQEKIELKDCDANLIKCKEGANMRCPASRPTYQLSCEERLQVSDKEVQNLRERMCALSNTANLEGQSPAVYNRLRSYGGCK